MDCFLCRYESDWVVVLNDQNHRRFLAEIGGYFTEGFLVEKRTRFDARLI